MTMTMTIDTGTARALDFVEPLPGFGDQQAFTLTPIDDRGLLYSMRSVTDPGLRFVLTPPSCFFADYDPELAPLVAEALGAGGTDDVELLVMVTVSTALVDATANLRAPIAVGTTTGRAMQVVLDDESLPMQRRLVAG